MLNANKCKKIVSAIQNTLDPTPNDIDFADNATITASNLSRAMPPTCKPLCAVTISSLTTVINAVTIGRDQAIADMGAASIFIMEGINVVNKRIATTPLTINLPDEKKVKFL